MFLLLPRKCCDYRWVLPHLDSYELKKNVDFLGLIFVFVVPLDFELNIDAG